MLEDVFGIYIQHANLEIKFLPTPEKITSRRKSAVKRDLIKVAQWIGVGVEGDSDMG